MADDVEALIEFAGNADSDDVSIVSTPTETRRDSYGRFAPNAEDEAELVAARAAEREPSAATPPARADAPATFREMQEFLAETEARKNAERRAEQLQFQLDQNKPKPAAADPARLFEDPDGYIRDAMAPFQADMQALRMQNAELMARSTHGDALTAAQKWLQESKDEAFAQTIMRQPGNPFDNLVRAHRQDTVLSAVPDGDISKYQEKLLDDPAFIQRVLAKLNAGQAPAPGQTRGNVTRMPSAARAGTAATAAIPDDLSDHDLIDSVLAMPRRR